MRNLWTLALLAPLFTSAQTIELSWPNTPCGVLLHCDSGCTACNSAVASSTLFTSGNMAHTGIDICPINDGGADNVLATYGWQLAPDSSRSLFISVIALQPTRLDSIIIRHGSAADGPEHVRVSIGMNEEAATLIAESATTTMVHDQVFTDLGCVEAGPGMAYGFFQLRLQAFGSNAGPWYLDDLRILGSACTANSIAEIVPRTTENEQRTFDVLGRPVNGPVAAGAYVRGQRRVLVP